MRTLLVDVGNTRIKWRATDRPDGFDAIPTTEVERLVDALRRLGDSPVHRAVVSCVAGTSVMAALGRALRAAWPAIAIREIAPELAACGVVNGYAIPSRLGADRWAALIGAHAGWPVNPLLVCGFGTATTIDLLIPAAAGAAHFVGGSILPGIEAMRRSLRTATSQLSVADGRAVDFAIRTEDAIESGILMAQVGAVRMALAAAAPRLVSAAVDAPLLCLVAGGDAGRVGPDLSKALAVDVRVVPDLVLRGLATYAAQTTPRPVVQSVGA